MRGSQNEDEEWPGNVVRTETIEKKKKQLMIQRLPIPIMTLFHLNMRPEKNKRCFSFLRKCTVDFWR